MGKKNDAEKINIIKAVLRAEWGSPAGKANVFFVLLLVMFTLVDSNILKMINIVGAYMSTCITGKSVMPYVMDSGVSPFLICTIIIMIFCLLLMFLMELQKSKCKSNSEKTK